MTALADQDPDERRDERLGRGEHDVARVGRGIAERLEQLELAVAGDRELAARQQPGVDLALGSGAEGFDLS